MKGFGLLLLFWLLATPLPLPAQVVALTPVEDNKGTYLGVLFSPVTEALYDQLPQLPRNQGVLITHVLPDSPGAHAGLHRHDILLEYQHEKIRDCEHLARLIQNDKPDRKVAFLLLRAGKEMSLEATLGVGPVMRIASAVRTSPAAPEPRGVAKPGGPPAISISAKPLENGKMKVAIEYYQDGTGRLRTVTCEGSSAEIDGEVEKLPNHERSLVQAALKHIRALNTQKVFKPAANDR